MTVIYREETGASTSLHLRLCLDERAVITAEADFIGHVGKIPVLFCKMPVVSRKHRCLLSHSRTTHCTGRSVCTGSVGETAQCPLADAARIAAAACTQSMASTTASAVTASLGSAMS